MQCRIYIYTWQTEALGYIEITLYEEFKDTKRIIRIHKSKKNRQYNSKEKKRPKKNNDLQNTTQKTKDRVRQTPLNTGMISDVPEGYAFPTPPVTPVNK